MKKTLLLLALIVVSISINLNGDKVQAIAVSEPADSLSLPIHPPTI